MARARLTFGELHQLKRFNTPSVYNGWEQVTRHDRRTRTNVGETRDFMPHMGPMIGYAVTVTCEPSEPRHQRASPNAPADYRAYIAGPPGPKIVVVQDLDTQTVGSYWGEVTASTHRALGCVGTITDGAIRDLDEMHDAGFKALARRLCVGHAFSWPVAWNVEVEVFGCSVRPGELIHADKHGFLVIPEEDEHDLLEAVRFMDANECATVIAAARASSGGAETDEILVRMGEAAQAFGEATRARFGTRGEW